MQALAKLRRFSAATASEDEPGLKWDRCVADMIVKTGTQYTLQYTEYNHRYYRLRTWYGVCNIYGTIQTLGWKLPYIYLSPVAQYKKFSQQVQTLLSQDRQIKI